MSTTLHSTEALLSQVSWLRALALELVQDRGEAEDLAQETLLRALEHPPRADGAMRGFLRRISQNLVRDRARSETRRKDRETLAARDEAVSPTDDVVDRLHAHRRLVEAIERLDEPYRATILLRYFDGLAPREIAEVQSAPVKTVNTRLSRGIEHLRAELDQRSSGNRRQWALALLPFLERVEPSVPLAVAPAKTLAALAAGIVVIAAGAFVWLSRSSDEPRTPADAIATTTSELKALAGALEGPSDAHAREPIEPRTAAIVTQRLTGRVVGADGSPVARANVSAFFRPAAGIQGRTGDFATAMIKVADAVASEEGRFEISVPGNASYRLEARASGLGTEIRDDVLAGDEVAFELKRAGRFEFTVLHDEGDAPCADAELTLSRTGIAGSIFEGKTHSDGRASVAGLAPGVYLVEVTPRDAERVFTIDLVLQPGETFAHVLRAKPGRTVRGTVHGATDGAPIAGARVIHRPSRVVTTDVAGNFEMRGLPSSQSRVALEIEADGFAPFVSRLDPRASDPVQAALAPEARVSGRLVDSNDVPVPSAWIVVDGRETRTKADGTFVVRGLSTQESSTCFARALGNATALVPKAISPGDNDWGTIVLEGPASVSGRVLTPDGKPLAGATVTLKTRGELATRSRAPTSSERVLLDDETIGVERTTAVVGVGSRGSEQRSISPFSATRSDAGPLRDRTVRTSQTGRFQLFDLPAGSYQLTARGQGHAATAPIDIDLGAGEERGGIELQVARGSTIAGHVRADDGTPIAGAWVVLKETSGKHVGVNCLSALDGSFTLHGVAPASYELEVTFHGLVAGRAYTDAKIRDLAPPVRDLDVRLAPLAFIEGVLVDDANRPIPNVYVRATDTESRRVSAATDERGRFKLGVVEGRTANLDVQGPVERVPLTNGNSNVEPQWKGELSAIEAGTADVVLRARRVE